MGKVLDRLPDCLYTTHTVLHTVLTHRAVLFLLCFAATVLFHVHPPRSLSPSLPNRLRHCCPRRGPTPLHRVWCTCFLPAVCPYRLDCPSQAGCVLLACSPPLLCQTADCQIKRAQPEQQGGRETHSHTGSRDKRGQRGSPERHNYFTMGIHVRRLKCCITHTLVTTE